MQSPRGNVELPVQVTTASGESYMPSGLYLEHHAARSYCLRRLKWQAPALLTVRGTGTIPTVATILYTVLEYNAYSTLHWVAQRTGSNLCEESSVGWREYAGRRPQELLHSV